MHLYISIPSYILQTLQPPVVPLPTGRERPGASRRPMKKNELTKWKFVCLYVYMYISQEGNIHFKSGLAGRLGWLAG